jgi:hypothetical protein
MKYQNELRPAKRHRAYDRSSLDTPLCCRDQARAQSRDGEYNDRAQQEREQCQSKILILHVSNQQTYKSCCDPADNAESQAKKAGDDKDPH